MRNDDSSYLLFKSMQNHKSKLGLHRGVLKGRRSAFVAQGFLGIFEGLLGKGGGNGLLRQRRGFVLGMWMKKREATKGIVFGGNNNTEGELIQIWGEVLMCCEISQSRC